MDTEAEVSENRVETTSSNSVEAFSASPRRLVYMDDKDKINKKLEITDEKMHKRIVPVLHAALWFAGLFFTKYAAFLLGVDPEKENIVNILNVLPAFFVFILEIAVTFQDIKVSHNAGQLLHMQAASVLARFCLVIGAVALFGVLYAIKPKAEGLFVLLMLTSVVLKHMEYYLLNNLDTYVVERPRDIAEVIYDPQSEFSRD